MDMKRDADMLAYVLGHLIPSRSRLPGMLEVLGLRGEGVEIGVEVGEFSEILLRQCRLSRLYSVDCWQEFDSSIYRDGANVTQEEHERKYQLAVKRLRRFKNRSRIIRQTSVEAAAGFKQEALSFVYIDANHSYGMCKKDIEAWWPKCRKGGVFAGHDYLHGKFWGGVFGVKKAVDEFVKKHRQRLFLIPGPMPTWYVIKGLDRRMEDDLLGKIVSLKRKECLGMRRKGA
jgi:hypothetical protein